MKRTMKISKLFAVFAVMVLALADNVYAQSGASDFVRILTSSTRPTLQSLKNIATVLKLKNGQKKQWDLWTRSA